MNVIIHNNKKYLYESFWKKDDLIDSEGSQFKLPKENKLFWTDKQKFVDKLIQNQKYLESVGKYYAELNKYSDPNCLICGEHITRGFYILNNIVWTDGLLHYIQVHNIKPSNYFIDKIFGFNPILKQKPVKYKSNIYNINKLHYVKLERNQIMIMDAVMKHGGYSRKYIDTSANTVNNTVYKYSEHAGILDFNSLGLERIIISGKTNRLDIEDNDIFLPKNMHKAHDYEYLFHTHPPTPKPGGRVSQGILYEFPSINDIFHFIDHYNDGKTLGSIVITPEGLYLIKKYVYDMKKIKINEEKLYSKSQAVMRKAQYLAIEKYTTQFSTYDFYSKISQDRLYIDMINELLNKYDLHIDFYSRIKDSKSNWIIDTIYLPIYL